MVPRTTSVVAHEAGVDAAKWMMEQLENSGEERRKLLIEWCRLLLERKELIQPLGIPQILIRRAADPSQEVSSRVVLCLAKLIEGDKDSALECIRVLHEREDLLTRRAMADVLTRLFRRITIRKLLVRKGRIVRSFPLIVEPHQESLIKNNYLILFIKKEV